MRSLSASLRAAQRGSQAHSQTPYVRLIFRPPDNLLTGTPARIYTTRQAPNRILSFQHLQSRYGASLPVTETPNTTAIIILSNHDGSLSSQTWEGWVVRPYFGLVVGGTPEYQEAESLLVSRAIFNGSEGTSTLELHLISAWGRLTQRWINRTTSSGPVKWLRGDPSFRRTIGQIVHQLCGGDTPTQIRIANHNIEYSGEDGLLSTYAPLTDGTPSIVDWDGTNLFITNTEQKFNTINIGIRNGDATDITAIFPNATFTLTGDLSQRGVITIRLNDALALTSGMVLNHNGSSLEIEYITTGRDLGLHFTYDSQLDYEPTYVSRGQANLVEVLKEILSRTTYRPLLRETGITLVDIGIEPSSVEDDTSRQYLVDHQIFSHQPSKRLLVPNEVVVSSLAQGAEPTLQTPYWEGSSPLATEPITHPAIRSQLSQGKITRYEVESSISSNAEAQTIADAYINALAFDAATARFSAGMDAGLEVYDNVLVGHDVTNTNLDAGDPWTGLTSLGYVSDILRTWTPGFYRMSVTLGDIQTVYIPLTQSRLNYLIQQGLLTNENQEDGLFEVSEIFQADVPFDTYWGRAQSLSINTIIPTGNFPRSGLQGSRWSAIYTDSINIGNREIIADPGTPQERILLSPIIRLMPDVAANGLIIDSGGRPSTVRPNNLVTDLGSSTMYWDTLYINRIAAVGMNPFMVGFSSIILQSSITEVSAPGQISLVGSDVHIYSGGDIVDLSNLGPGGGTVTLVAGPGILVAGNIIILDNDDMPPLYPENSINTLGLATNPWDALFVDHIYLTVGEGPSTVNGALWLGTNNDILARTGGVTKNLSDIGSSPTLTSGPGILVAGNIIALDSDDMPELQPSAAINSLGSTAKPWDGVYVDHLKLTPNESASDVNGIMWQDSNGDIQARTGGATKNLSNISSAALTGSHGILVSGHNIILDSDDMPPLYPADSINTLGLATNPWDALYVDHLYLHVGEVSVSTNGVMWQNSDGNILARTGGVTKNLSDIGSGGDTVTLVAGPGILVAGYIITLDSDDMPELQPANSANSLGSTAKPWDSLYTDHVRLTANEGDSNANGVIWQDNNGDIRARTGGSTKNLSDISTGTIILTGGNGILVSGYTIILDNDDMPPLYPENSGNTLGLLSNPWDSLYVDHVRLTANEAASNINGVIWQDSNGDIQARSGGVTRNLSDIGSGSSGVTISQVNTAITNHASNANAHHTPASDITLTSGPGILVSGYVIALDSDDMPPLYPANSANSLGISSNPWDALHVDHIYLHPNEAAVNTNGVIWQDSSGNIQARSGDSTVSLSDIGSGGGDITLVAGAGISVLGYTISLNGSNVPTLLPASNANDLGATFRPWDRLYVDHIYLHSAEAALTVNGTIWQDASGNIQARSGGTTRSLSDIGSGSGTVTLTGSHGILVSGPSPYIIILDSDDMPPLSPENSINGLGLSSNPWDNLYVDHIYLHVGEAASSVNGAMWQDSSGNIMARTGGVTQNLSAIGTSNGGSITLVAGAGISVSGYTITLDNNNMPPLYPANSINALGFEANSWSRLYVDYIYLHAGETTPFINGTMWQDSSGHIRAYSGGAIRNLSDIGSGSGTTVTGGVGISILGTAVTIDGNDLPTLRPRSSDQDLGTSTYFWDRLYVDHIFLHMGEGLSSTNGSIRQDSSGNIIARSGGADRNLSDIGTSNGGSITLVGSTGISVNDYTISIDGSDTPTLLPRTGSNNLGSAAASWDRLYVDHISLHAGEGTISTNGYIWQDSSGDIRARSGGVTRNLSDIGSGDSVTLVAGNGISVSGYTISIDGTDMPPLHPSASSNRLGASNNPWDGLYVDELRLTPNQSSQTTNGVMWQDSSGHIMARTGGITKSLTDIGLGGGGGTVLTAGGGITVAYQPLSSSWFVGVSGVMPSLRPESSGSNLGTTNDAWGLLYIDYILLTASSNALSSTINGVMWQDGSTNILVRSGGLIRNLSYLSGPILDPNNLPTLQPASSGNNLGNSGESWDRLYINRIYLHPNEIESFTNGTIWQGGGGRIYVRTGGVTKDLNNIGSGGGDGPTYISGTGIIISGSIISLDNLGLPSLVPAASNNVLGVGFDPWDKLYVDHIYLTPSEGSVATNGVMWLNSSGNIIARSGGVYRNLSDIGSGGGGDITLVSGAGISVSGYTISVDGVNMPSLRPASSNNDLGIASDPWDSLYVDHLYLHAGEGSSSTNGTIWQSSGGDIFARSGGATRNLSDIGSGGGGGITNLVGGHPISVTGSGSTRTVSLIGSSMPTLAPDSASNDLGTSGNRWDTLYVDHISLRVGEGSISTNGYIWQDSSGDIQARSGGVTRNLSDIGSGDGGITDLLTVGSDIIPISSEVYDLGSDTYAWEEIHFNWAKPGGFLPWLGEDGNPFIRLYIQEIYLQNPSTPISFSNGQIWLGSNNHIYVRTGGVTKDLSDI